MKGYSGRVVVVTGGSGNIGEYICRSFANSSNKIIFTYFSNKKVSEKIVRDISCSACNVSCYGLDVVSLEKVKIFINMVIGKYGRIDVLVNNAGISKDKLLFQMSEKDWSDVINVNLKGTFNCTKIVSKFMLKQKYGRIVNISSIVGITGNSGQCNYSASKAGIISFTKSIAKELGPRNITANVVAPGYIKSNMTEKIGEKIRKEIINKIPLGRPGTPIDVSNAVFFLASDEASYITGQVFNVNGGMYM